MTIGEKLLKLRKDKKLSQEEVADKLNVTRQTISKWETDQSTPDFDKIVPICDLYNITTEELLRGTKSEKVNLEDTNQNKKNKKAFGIGLGIFLYFLAVAEISVTVPLRILNPILASAIFLVICGIATACIVYVSMTYKTKKSKNKINPLVKQITEIISIIILIIYLVISFITMAWAITWLIWIVYALIEEIIKLIFMLRGDYYEE